MRINQSAWLLIWSWFVGLRVSTKTWVFGHTAWGRFGTHVSGFCCIGGLLVHEFSILVVLTILQYWFCV